MAVYDSEDKTKDLNQLTPGDLDSLEQKYSTPKDEKEDEAIEAGADEDGTKRGGMGRKLRKHGEGSEAEEEADLKESLGSGFKQALADDGLKDTGFYKNKDGTGTGLAKKSRSGLGRFARNRWALGGASAGILGLALGGFALFGFLNIFKLEHLLDNIDAKAFSRINATFDNRSDKWVKAYVRLRLSEIEGSANHDTLIFRANKVDTNSPIRDWYRTMRTSSFEKKLFNDQGIRFESIAIDDGDGGVILKPAVIQLDNQPGLKQTFEAHTNGLSMSGRQIKKGVLESELRNFLDPLELDSKKSVVKVFDDNKSVRKAIKTAVNDNTHFLQVFRKRHLRKDIQNMIGVSDWKFFEKTRNNFNAKKSEVQKKLLRKLIPPDTKSGKFLLCIFGAGACAKNIDPNNIENKNSNSFTASGTVSEGQKNAVDDQGHVSLDEEGKLVTIDPGSNSAASTLAQEEVEAVEEQLERQAIEEAAERKINTVAITNQLRADLLKTVMEKINIVTTVISVVKTMDTLSRIDKNITEGKLSQIAVLAKGAQAASAYATYAIMRDQARSGQLTAEEYNIVIKSLDGAENSEAGDIYLNDKQSTVSAISSKTQFCDLPHVPTEKDYFWNCDRTKIGGTTNASRIEDAYNGSVGVYLHPIAESYRQVRDTPGIKQTFDFLNWCTGQVGFLTSKIIDPVFEAIGLTAGVEKAMVWLTESIVGFLGAGPILTGVNDLSGLTLTMIGEGATYTAENSARGSGAAISNPVSKANTDKMTLAYLDEQEAGQSFGQRYLATSNPSSLASKAMYSLTNFKFSKLGSLGSWFSNMVTNVGSIFGRQSQAASVSNGADFAGIDTYDFPPQCTDQDPLDVTSPSQLTNADELSDADGNLFLESSEVTMALLDDPTAFWNKIYERVGDNGTDPKTVLEIYNCETLDQRVRGSLGFTSGYTKDNGLEDGSGN